MEKAYINPPELFDSLQFGFSQIVMTPPGNTIYLSGQVAWDENQQIVGEGDLKTQTQKSLENIENALKKIGGTRRDVVSLRIYFRESELHNTKAISDGLLTFFPKDAAPASTWIGVPTLAREEFLIEIEAIAVMAAS